jgi:small subunit ribosomal protein S20
LAENTETKGTKETKAVAKKVKSTSAEKYVRVSGRKQLRNKSARSQAKTSIAKAEKLISSGELEAARAAALAAVASMDRAVGKGILPGNNAARRKSRLMKKLNAAPAAKAGSKESK